MKILNKDGFIAGAEIALSALFFQAGVMKILYVRNLAPASQITFFDAFVPAYLQTPLFQMVGISGSLFMTLLGLFEMIAAIAFFYRPKPAALAVMAIMLGGEYTLYMVNQQKRPPTHMMCQAGQPTCLSVNIFHAIILALAGLVYAFGAPLCKQCVIAMKGTAQARGVSPRKTKNPYATRNRKKDQ